MFIKRKTIAILSLVLLLGSSLGGVSAVGAQQKVPVEVKAQNITFTDVPKEHNSYTAIMYLAQNGIISGYGDGTFGSHDEVTRGQVATLISRYLNLTMSDRFENPYTDVAGTMFEKAILAVSEQGYMGGKGNHLFDPNGVLTRAEMAAVLTEVFDLQVKTTDLFWDMKKDHWASESVQALYSNGLTFGSGDNKFMPTGKVSRGEYAEFLYRGIHLNPDFVAKPIPTNPAANPKPLKPEPKPELTPPEIHVDGVKVKYPVNPIVKDGTTLVPLKETLEAMGAKVYWNQTNKYIYATIGNKRIRLQINSSEALINKEQVELVQPPIIHQGNTMVPLRFVSEAFNRSLDYNKKNNVIEMTMKRFISEFLTKEIGEIANIINVDNVQLADDRRFMLSDNPETLDARSVQENNATLWNDLVKEESDSIDHRVVGWHANQFSGDVTIGITIENLPSTNSLQVKHLEGVHKISADSYNYAVGLPMAEAVLNDQLSKLSVKNDSQAIVLDTFTLKPEEMVGFLNEFTVTKASGTGELNYIIRTVVTQDNSNLTDIKSIPVPIDYTRTHPRGVWSSSKLLATLPVYDVATSTERSYNISNGVSDDLFNEHNSLVTNASSLANKGHYGAVYAVKIPYVNKTKTEKTLRIRVGSRGGIYSGAVKTEHGVFNIAGLRPMQDVVTILERKVSDDEGFIEFEFMHAGGSFLPIAISIDTVK